jgi:hypothetical protein
MYEVAVSTLDGHHVNVAWSLVVVTGSKIGDAGASLHSSEPIGI